MKLVLLNRYSLMYIVFLFVILAFSACNSSASSVRIRTDLSGAKDNLRDDKEKSFVSSEIDEKVNIEVNEGLTFERLLIKANQALNYFVKAQDFLAEGDLIKSEKYAVLSLETTYTNESIDLLITIYDLQENFNKKDSCILVKKLKSENFNY
ncbi:hypothetical protein [uncultured Algoriphagus sp.]|uniref:hypothetical protein n=1 Tax=uncultured Algoriphagus sp. TaxID=417365 RepID=UPI00259A4A11|nr:hypothetical protein [uncultured Algoriphagus sp.]